MKKMLLLGFVMVASSSALAQTDWPTYGHDAGGDRFSPLTQITPQNVKDLKVAWVYHMKPANAPDVMPSERGPGGPPGARPGAPPRPTPGAASSSAPGNAAAQAAAEGIRPARRPARFLASEVTPIVAGCLMYLSTPYSRIVAPGPTSGKEVWAYTTPAGSGAPSLRGVEYWPGDAAHLAQIFFRTRDGLLIALDAKTGKTVASFGADGIVDMRTPETMNGSTRGLGMTSPPIVYKNLVITGSVVQESPSQGPAGDIRAWDVTTGKLVWTFHSVPRPGEKGHDTWRGDDWQKRSGTNVWGFLTIDKACGIIYMPFGAPTAARS